MKKFEVLDHWRIFLFLRLICIDVVNIVERRSFVGIRRIWLNNFFNSQNIRASPFFNNKPSDNMAYFIKPFFRHFELLKL